MSEDFPNRSPRVAAPLEVRFRTAGQFLVSYCLNLSRGGLFVTTERPLPVGALVTLDFHVPGLPERKQLEARVRWVRAAEDESGPPGMGLQIERIDEVLGDHIDRIVSRATPLRIDLIGRADRAWRHMEALVRSLVTCDTRRHAMHPGVEQHVSGADLLLLDVDAAPQTAVAILHALGSMQDGPPALALCDPKASGVRNTASKLARVVDTPVDRDALQQAVLETLSQARLSETDESP